MSKIRSKLGKHGKFQVGASILLFFLCASTKVYLLSCLMSVSYVAPCTHLLFVNAFHVWTDINCHDYERPVSESRWLDKNDHR